ncbi:MAG: serine hydrolase [Candidatus Heimdallarchaeota archaeon]
MTISVVRDDQLILAKGYGYRDLAPLFPVNPNRTLFRIGSVSKTFSAVAVLQLVEDNILDLDTDVNNYLTAFKIPETYSEPITLKHLLTHSAGFEELAGRIFFDTPGIVLPMEDL